MAKCLKCGKMYLTKDCTYCRDHEYKYNNKSKKINNLWKIAFFILLLVSSLITAIGIFKIKDLENISNAYDKKIKIIEKLKIKKQQLERRIAINERLIKSLTKQNRELVHKSRNTNTYKSSKRYIETRKKTNQPDTSRYSKNTNSRKKTNNINNKSTKKYINYNGYKKLISDSRIHKKNDNRLKSNSPIYAIYKRPLNQNINCGNNPKIYKIRNECNSIEPYTNDKLYFSKSNINELKSFNTKTHQIECKYSQEHGVMHDCRTKIFKYIFKK